MIAFHATNAKRSSPTSDLSALRAERDAAREERDEYRIEADKAIQDYDALELVTREAFEKIAQRTAIVTHTKTGVVYRSSPEWTGEGANRIAKEAIVAIEELETQHGGRLAAAEAREAVAVERARTLQTAFARLAAHPIIQRHYDEDGVFIAGDLRLTLEEIEELAALAEPKSAAVRDDTIARLTEAIDTADWLLHVDRSNADPKIAAQLTKGEGIKRDVVELLRAALAAVSPEQPPPPHEPESGGSEAARESGNRAG